MEIYQQNLLDSTLFIPPILLLFLYTVRVPLSRSSSIIMNLSLLSFSDPSHPALPQSYQLLQRQHPVQQLITANKKLTTTNNKPSKWYDHLTGITLRKGCCIPALGTRGKHTRDRTHCGVKELRKKLAWLLGMKVEQWYWPSSTIF